MCSTSTINQVTCGDILFAEPGKVTKKDGIIYQSISDLMCESVWHDSTC